jgi:HAD superfamily hydrolase (TIGR01662 family)
MSDSKEEARLKKYEKTYGKEGAKVRNRIFKSILANAQDGTKAGQWSARKAQSLTEDYEKAMKGKGKKAYKSSKRTKTQKSLKKWGDQKWKTKSGQDSSKTGERYLPEKAIKALTDKEYKKTSAKKRKDMKQGKQFSDQPKNIAKKVAQYRAEPYSVDVSRSTNKEKKLMAVFEDKEGKKVKTTHFGQRGASDYTKHGERERMERYLERHGGGTTTSTKENWKDPTTAGSLSRWVLWNKPSFKGSFADYKRRFGLKGNLKVSRSADTFESRTNDMLITYVERIHPDDDYMQEQLMNDITSGRKKVSYEEMFGAETFEYTNEWYNSALPRIVKRVKEELDDDGAMKLDDPKMYALFEDEMFDGEPTSLDSYVYNALELEYPTLTEKQKIEISEDADMLSDVWFGIDMTDEEFRDWLNEEYDDEGNLISRVDWGLGESWGEYEMNNDEPFGELEWNDNDIGYTPEMLKAKRMKNRYLPLNMKLERKEGRKYLFLDFDNTVRHTVPDPQPDEPLRRRPPHKAFEVVMIDGVAEKVRSWQDAGYFIVGLTNQSNIESGFNTNQDVVDAIKETLNQLGMQFPVYYASHKNPKLPDYVLRKPRTGMIDAAFRDFGSPDYTYTVMVGDDWEGADSGMAANAGVNFIGVLPFIGMGVDEAQHEMYMMHEDGQRLELLNPDDLIYTFAEEYSRKMNTHSAESSYSKSTTKGTGIGMFGGKTNMGLLLGIAGGFLLGWNAPNLMSSMKMKKSAESGQSMANQGFMEDWVGGEGGQGDVEQANAQEPAPLKYDYDPLKANDATSFDPLTRPPSAF